MIARISLKRVLFIFLSVSVLFASISTPIFATSSNVPSVQPRWKNVVTIAMSLNFDEPIVSIVISIGGQPNSTFTDGVVTLEKISGYDAGTVYTWNNISSDLPFLHFGDDTTVPRTIGTYRLTITITTHGANGTEVVTKSTERTY